MKPSHVLAFGALLALVAPCATAQTTASVPPATTSVWEEIDALLASESAPKTVRWEEGAPHSRQFLFQGHRVRVLLADSIAVVAYLESADDPLRVQLWFVNQTDGRFDVIPERFSLAVVQPKPKPLAYVSPQQIKKRIDDAANWAAVAEAMASVSRAFAGTSTTTTSGTVTVSDSRGRSAFGTYNGVATTYDHSANMQQTASNLSAVMASVEDQKARELTGVILPNTVFAGQEYFGVVHFKREKRATLMLLRVPVGRLVFEFPLEMPNR